MSITIRRGASTAVGRVYPSLVYLRSKWSDPWTPRPDLRPLRVELPAGSDGVGSAEVARWFGSGAEPWEGAVAAREPVRIEPGTWIRIAQLDGGGQADLFVGLVTAETRDLHGASLGPSGVQTWAAAGPADILRRIPISRSYWRLTGDTAPREIGWVPSLNDRDSRGLPLGNRTATPRDGCYHFGGTWTWTHFQYLEYVLRMFCDTDDVEWTLAGQTDLIKEIREPFDPAAIRSAADALAAMIPREQGLDWLIASTDDGFEIRVFSLNSRAYSFGGITLHANPNRLSFTAGETLDNEQTTVTLAADESVGKIRVLGERIVVAATFWGSSLATPATLLPGWTPDEQNRYFDPSAEVDAADAPDGQLATAVAQFRESDAMDRVFSRFVVAPEFRDRILGCCPTPHPDGTVTADLDGSIDNAPYQPQVIQALAWLPMYADRVYGETASGDFMRPLPPGVNADAGPPLYKPSVWFARRGDLPEGHLRMERCDHYGVGMSILRDQLGVELHARPSEVVGIGEGQTIPHSDTETRWMHGRIAALLAWRTDQRLMLEYDVPGQTDNPTVKEIEVRDAESWWIAKYAIVTVAPTGLPVLNAAPRETRNDASRLAAVMAGAIPRYGAPRSRAIVTLRGVHPAGWLLGRILDSVLSGGVPHEVAGPITRVSIAWSNDGGATTTVATGYAGGEV